MDTSTHEIKTSTISMKNASPKRSVQLSRGFLMGLERSLPSFHHLFSEYQKALEEKIRYEKELEHETYSMHDLQLELDHYQQAIIRLSIKDDFQKELDQLDHIEVTNKDLKREIQVIEDRLTGQDQETRKAIASLKDYALEEATMAELEFKSEINKIEAKFVSKMKELRDENKNKAEAIRTAKQKKEFEHAKRKEELRKIAANRMKSTSHHIECRSIELDLKRQISCLEKELKTLEQQHSKRKLPLTFTNSKNSLERSSPQQSKQMHSNLNPSTPKQPANITTAVTPTQQNISRTGISARKRKLYSVNSEFIDF